LSNGKRKKLLQEGVDRWRTFVNSLRNC